MYILLTLVAYLAVGYFLHLIAFPEEKPSCAEYFKPGLQFYSAVENMRQTVVRHERGIVYCSSEVGPFAAGPPKHVHNGFDECLEVANGELSVWVAGRIVKLRPGGKLHIPKGIAHKPFNETADTILINGTAAFPERFAFALTQVYGVMDSDPSFGKSPRTMLQMAMFAANGFDAHLVEGPPPFIRKVTTFLVVPMARFLGYKSYYSEYDIRIRRFQE